MSQHVRSSILAADTFRAIDGVMANPTRPRDSNQLAKLISDIVATDVDSHPMTEDGRDLAAVLLGRRGGLKGGKARAIALSSERRSEIARTAAKKRWSERDG